MPPWPTESTSSSADPRLRIAYVWSLRNAAADRAGQLVPYDHERRYMMSPLEHLVGALNRTALGDSFSLEAVISDDDPVCAQDRMKLDAYGFEPGATPRWFFPLELDVRGRRLTSLLRSVPSNYRRLPRDAPERREGKQDFERRLASTLTAVGADLVILDGLLVILDELVRPHSPFYRKIFNIHPGITREDSAYQRRGAHATLDALHGARGERVVDWTTMEMRPAPTVRRTGASFHYVDQGIDSGEVVLDVLKTEIRPEDTMLELRWNNFQQSLFPALILGLTELARARASAER